MTTTIHHSLDSRADAGAVKDTDPEVPEHPERFVRRPPVPPELPGAVWFNKPGTTTGRGGNDDSGPERI